MADSKHRARSTWSGWLLGSFGILLIAAGAAVLVAQMTAPEVLERSYGAVKLAVQSSAEAIADSVVEASTGERQLPTATLGESSSSNGILDLCGGEFYGMLSYESEDATWPPVFAAHNNCGGDVVLSWKLGQEVFLEEAGEKTVYRIVDIREIPKTWSTTADLKGLGGELALQTCLYGEDFMRFVGLEAVKGGGAEH